MRCTGKLRSLAFGVVLLATFSLSEGTRITPPKNKFPLDHDIQIGREAAAEVRQQLPLLPENGDVDTYVKRVGVGLASAIPPEYSHQEFHYEFRVVNVSDINAFALPGGPMFVNRGMIEAAHNEGEMAGVMAHEMSHVALRHGTAQETKAQGAGFQLGAIGAAVLGTLGGVGKIAGQGAAAGLGLAMNKFSREDETQADVLGSQIMARAGYDPQDLANMFKTIEKQSGSGGPQFMSDHPSPGNRYERISQEAKLLTIASNIRSQQSAEFNQAQAALKSMPKARTTAEISSANAGKSQPGNTNRGGTISANVERPSTQYTAFEQQGLIGVSIPNNWKQFRENSSVTFAPEGGYGTSQGASVVTHGAIVGVTAAQATDLTTASDRYVEGILKGNTYLSANGSYTNTHVGQWDGLQRRLTGASPITHRQETVDVSTALIGNGQILYVLQIVPTSEQDQYRSAFLQMLRSVHSAN